MQRSEQKKEEKSVNVNFCPSRDMMPMELRKCRDQKQLDTLSICDKCLFRSFEGIPGNECRSCDARPGRIKQ